MTRGGGVKHAVVDASVLVDFLLVPEPGAPLARLISGRGFDLHTPMLCDVEVAAGLQRAVRRKLLSVSSARSALSDLAGMPLTRYPHQPILGRALELHQNFSVYDATYVALAEALGAPLLTADARLARAVRAHTGVAVLASG